MTGNYRIGTAPVGDTSHIRHHSCRTYFITTLPSQARTNAIHLRRPGSPAGTAPEEVIVNNYYGDQPPADDTPQADDAWTPDAPADDDNTV